MMIGSYPYLVNPSGMGGFYAAAVSSQAVQPVAAVPSQTNNAFIKFGGALSGQTDGGNGGGQPSSSSYTPGSTLNISA